MTPTTARKTGLITVMVGALALSFHGQVHATAPQLGQSMAVILAIVNDIASLLALNEVMAAAKQSAIRRWSWSVLILAGGDALSLNTWDALRAHVLPPAFAVLVGAGPVVLAWVLSHVIALSLAADSQSVAAAASQKPPTRQAHAVQPAPPPPAPKPSVNRAPAPAADRSGGFRFSEVTDELIVQIAALDEKSSRGRVGYRVIATALDVPEHIARKARVAVDDRKAAGGQVIPMHRTGNTSSDAAEEDTSATG